jgi:hypothetical protein
MKSRDPPSQQCHVVDCCWRKEKEPSHLLQDMFRILPRLVSRAAPRHSHVLVALHQPFHSSTVSLEDSMRGGRARGRARTTKGAVARRPPPPSSDVSADPWVEVKDPASGQIYWWNQETNEV